VITYDVDTSSFMSRGNQGNDDSQTGGCSAYGVKDHRLGKSLADDGFGIGSQVLYGVDSGTIQVLSSDNVVSEG
jgi:hypothetical protein